MTKPLILLFVGIGITVLIGVLVVAVMVRTRRPGGGVREWIRESAGSWQENDHRAPREQSGQRVRLDTLLQEAAPGESSDPLAEVENLRSAAGQIWGEEVAAMRTRRAEKDAARQLKRTKAAAKGVWQDSGGMLPPAFAPAQHRRPPASAATPIVKDPEDSTSYLPQVPAVNVVAVSGNKTKEKAAGTQKIADTPLADKPKDHQDGQMRRWARKFTPDTPTEQTGAAELELEAHAGLPGDEAFHVDKVSWQPLKSE
ncbi:hypothetical protein [uncultured Varibaculum sp.]|uniref:hypothetical protein n=1 Tax=uncultured Varibaculum sp. TaxID=413896 RepID=UPI00259441B9|nr:hypothetical protein [uncultured Varibaculum sp.]